ncbi:GNAT family N-acetyltransferase [Metabacillus indicus]|uniref:GNAT family N-acetyltransferase n=1 Tax=Metabacillus indicus TaxID=246786 RepID=UPI002A090E77|nr:GNAT family N-acetyltransferase [Metabacillus indicus]MDX8290781.1 GNAT family N-acetyltransferase [Metabacillus indicus]
MKIELKKATLSDAEELYDIQVKAFMPLLEKYQDFDTNPANEDIKRVISRINHQNGGFYKILYDDKLIGAIRVLWKDGTTRFSISPMFILPEYQGKGIAQKTIKLVEEMYPHATTWELRTILEEERNCYLYEKMGYVKTGETKPLNERTTLVSYNKVS